MPPKPKAIVLLSGGLDSATTLAIARSQGFEAFALSFAYGQRHAAEIDAARRVAQAFGAIKHEIITIDLRIFGGSALTDDIAVPRNRSPVEIRGAIPITYVPARNTIFLSYALAWAEVLQARDIFIGVNAVDYSGYPDCRPEFIAAFERMGNLGTREGVEGRGVTIHTPLINLTKAQIIALGQNAGVDYGLTLTCYDPTPAGEACGACDACQLRLKGFREYGMDDPGRYLKRDPVW
ncbi:MAG: 7-cyano-7-deazaguanine synthase QueC [Gemmatimonadota bacterium]